MSSNNNNSSSNNSGTRGCLFASGGRFAQALNDPIMEKFNESIHFDKRMWREDLLGSQVYAKGTCRVGILTYVDCELLFLLFWMVSYVKRIYIYIYILIFTNVSLYREEERDLILSGLDQVYKEWEDGLFELKAGDEVRQVYIIKFYW